MVWRPTAATGSSACSRSLLALFVVAGASFQKTNGSGWLTSSPAAMFGTVVALVLIAAVLYIGLRLLFRWLDRLWDAIGRGVAAPG